MLHCSFGCRQRRWSLRKRCSSGKAAVDNICGTLLVGRKKGETPEQMLVKAIFGEEKASDMEDGELRKWGASVGLPQKLSLTALSELHDCGLFPENPCYSEDEYRISAQDNATFGAENIRQNMELVKMRLLAGALTAHYAEVEAEEGVR